MVDFLKLEIIRCHLNFCKLCKFPLLSGYRAEFRRTPKIFVMEFIDTLRTLFFPWLQPGSLIYNYTVRNNFRSGIGKARSGKNPIPHLKYRCHIGNTDVVSEKTDVVSEFFRYVPFRYPNGNYF
jgi:hypothetical protein